jgi:hypothetical protein
MEISVRDGALGYADTCEGPRALFRTGSIIETKVYLLIALTVMNVVLLMNASGMRKYKM